MAACRRMSSARARRVCREPGIACGASASGPAARVCAETPGVSATRAAAASGPAAARTCRRLGAAVADVRSASDLELRFTDMSILPILAAEWGYVLSARWMSDLTHA